MTEIKELKNIKIENPYKCYYPGCTSSLEVLKKVMFPVVFVNKAGEPIMKVACINCY